MWIYGTLAASLLLAISGVPGLVARRRSLWGQRLATVLVVAGAAVGVLAALCALMSGGVETLRLPAALPGSALRLKLDALSCFFLIPIFLIGGAGSVYGLSYWNQAKHLHNGQKLSLCYGLLIGALAMVVQSGDGVMFLFAWEIMALTAFFVVSTEDHKAEVRQAAWIYLLAAHVGTLCLFALFAVLRHAGGSFELRPLTSFQATSGVTSAVLLLSLAGFGIKAGMMPFHFWLPGAHANAPSHVSAILSGIVLKIGIYGLLRTLTLFPSLPAFWGVLVLILGTISAILGVVFALGQHDLKRLLAYHSIENIGIILMGLGLSLIGQATHRPVWAVLGMAGCLLHVWNHGLFKALLFLAAGSVIHSVHTRELDRMGGLASQMPWTAGMFAIGAVAICGLPPLNGFVSELLIYLGLFNSVAASVGPGASWSVIGLAAPALAAVGALAVACFVKAYGTAFLGVSRTDCGEHAHESPRSMLVAMAVLAGCCVMIGLFPGAVMAPLSRAVASGIGSAGADTKLSAQFPSWGVTTLNLCLIAASAAGFMGIRRLLRGSPPRLVPTWDCGYVRPTARIQYTASSFAQMLIGLFAWILRPHADTPRIQGLFARACRFGTHVPDMVLDGWLIPVWQRTKSALASMRVLQQGSIQQYMLYILLILFLLLLSLLPLGELIARLLGR
ncbi:MAG: proton-conducting transporter membrane subunit [Tepidisphaerales bacterium]